MSVLQRWAPDKLRAVLAAMPDTATILRNTPSSTPGGWSQSFVVVGTSPCRLVGITAPTEQLAAAEIASVTHWRLEVPAGTNIKPSDRVQVTGSTYEVLGAFGSKTFGVTDTFYLAEILRT